MGVTLAGELLALPGIWIVWLQPCCSRTIGGIVDIGDVLIKPLSALRVRLPLTLTSQEPPPEAKPIQQQLEYLMITKTVVFIAIVNCATQNNIPNISLAHQYIKCEEPHYCFHSVYSCFLFMFYYFFKLGITLANFGIPHSLGYS